VRSYRTVSPLPPSLPEASGGGGGGLFSVALSLISRPVAVSNHPDPRSPDFPLPTEIGSDRLDLSRWDQDNAKNRLPLAWFSGREPVLEQDQGAPAVQAGLAVRAAVAGLRQAGFRLLGGEALVVQTDLEFRKALS